MKLFKKSAALILAFLMVLTMMPISSAAITPSIYYAKVTLSQSSFVFDNESHAPSVVSITYDGKTVDPSNYEISEIQPQTNAGTYEITIKGKNDYRGTKEVEWKINKIDLTGVSVTPKEEILYTGDWVGPSASDLITTADATIDGSTVKFEYYIPTKFSYSDTPPKYLTEGAHTVEYRVTTNSGNYNTYHGTFTYNIVKERYLNYIEVVQNPTFTGESVSPLYAVFSKGGVLPLNTSHYTVLDNSDKAITAGYYTLRIEGAGGYTGTKTASWHIKKASLLDSNVNITTSDNLYYKKDTSQTLATGTIDFVHIDETKDPSIKYYVATSIATQDDLNGATWTDTAEATAAGLYYVYYKVEAGANYEGLGASLLRVKLVNIRDTTLTATVVNDVLFYYNGETKTPSCLVTAPGDLLPVTLEKDKDYTLSGETSGVNAGTYTIDVTGKNNYAGSSTTAKWTIHPQPLVDETTVHVEGNLKLVYNQADQKLVTGKIDYTHVDGVTDPKLEYLVSTYLYETAEDIPATGWVSEANATAKNPGTYYVYYRVADGGNYKGLDASTLRFRVSVISEATITVTIVSDATCIYDGTSQSPVYTVTAKGPLGLPVVLEENEDYEVVEGEKGINADTYTLKVKGIGNYKDSEDTAEWSIKKTHLYDEIKVEKIDGLVDNGTDQQLVTGSLKFDKVKDVTDPHLEYYVSKELLTSDSQLQNVTWVDSADKVTGKDADVYYVYYRVVEGGNYAAIPASILLCVPVFITGNNFTVTIPLDTFLYTGSSHSPEVIVTVPGEGGIPKVLKEGVDYEITGGASAVNAGPYTVSVKGLSTGKYANSSGTASWRIDKQPLIDGVSILITGKNDLVFNGKPQQLVDGSLVINKTANIKDPKIEYLVSTKVYEKDDVLPTDGWTDDAEATEAGTYYVYYRVADGGNYEGVDASYLRLRVAVIKSAKITVTTLGNDIRYFDGTTKSPTIVVSAPGVFDIPELLLNDEYEIVKNDNDYKYEAMNAGTYKIKVQGKKNYSAETDWDTWVIHKRPLLVTDLELKDNDDLTYTGKDQTLLTGDIVDYKAGEGTTTKPQFKYYVSTSLLTSFEGISADDWKDTAEKSAADDYYVYWKVIEGTNYEGIDASLNHFKIVTIEKADAPEVTVTGKSNLKYTGKDQELLASATPDGVEFRIGLTGTWVKNIKDVKGKDADVYHVYYRLLGDGNHKDVYGMEVVEIKKADYDKADYKFTANDRTYDATEKDLVTPDIKKGAGGTVKYLASTRKLTTEELKLALGWSTDVPEEEDADTYYVYWYVDGDDNHNDIEKNASNCVTVTISAADISEANVTMVTQILREPLEKNAEGIFLYRAYDGLPHSVDPTVTMFGETLSVVVDYNYGTPYEITKTDVGEYKLTLNGTGNYKGTLVIKWRLMGYKIESDDLILNKYEFLYSGNPITPEFWVLKEGTFHKLTLGTDYKIVEGSDLTATDNGTYKITVEGIGYFEGTATKEWTIKKCDIEDCIAYCELLHTYDGKNWKPKVTVRDPEDLKALKEGVDYEIDRTESIDAGSYSLKIKGINNYTGEDTLYYAIGRAMPTITIDPVKGLVYNTQSHVLVNEETFDYSGKDDASQGTKIEFLQSDGKTWSTKFPEGTDAGHYGIIYRFNGGKNYIGCEYVPLVEFAFIASAELKASMFTNPTDLVYNGKEQSIADKIIVHTEDGYLIPSTEYVILKGSQLSGNDAGDYTYYASAGLNPNLWDEGLGFPVTWNIAKKDPEAEDFVFTAPSAEELVFDGEEKAASIQLKSDYSRCGRITVLYFEDDGKTPVDGLPVDAGTYVVKAAIEGGKNFNASTAPLEDVSWTFTILPKEIEIAAKDITLKAGDRTYNGKEHKPAVTEAKYGTVVIPSDEYTVEWSNNVNAGKNTAVVTLVDKKDGNYTISGSKKFTILPKDVTVTADPAEKTYKQKDPKLTYTVSEMIGKDAIAKDDLLIARKEGEDADTYKIEVSLKEGAAAKYPNYSIICEDGEFTINPVEIPASAVVKLGKALVADGTEKVQDLASIKFNTDGIDYELTAKDYDISGNRGIISGKYSMTITGKGNYTGAISKVWVIAGNDKEDKAIGDFKVEVKAEENAPQTKINNSLSDMVQMVATADELAAVAEGAKMNIWLDVTDIGESVPKATKEAIVEKAKGFTILSYIDISLFKQLSTQKDPTRVTETSGPVSITIQLTDDQINKDAGMVRTYSIARVHDDEVDILEGTYDEKTKTVTFTTDRFSTYALLYKDTPAATPRTGDFNMAGLYLMLSALSIAALAWFGLKLRASKR